MIYVYYGNEPYLINKRLETELSELVKSGDFDLDGSYIKGPLDRQGFEDALDYGMFGKKFVVLMADDLKNPFIKGIFDNAPLDNEIRIVVKDVDRRSKAFKAVEAYSQEFSHLGADKFNNFLLYNIKGAKITEEDFDYLKERVAYGRREACDLYQVVSWLKLLVCCDVISRDDIDRVIPEYVNNDSFALYGMLISGAYEEYFKSLLNRIEREKDGLIGILSLLHYSFRLAYKQALFGKDFEKVCGVEGWKVKKKLPLETSREAMRLLVEAINERKAGREERNVAITVSSKLIALLKNKAVS